MRPNTSITLNLNLPHRVEHPRIEQVVEPRAGSWTHHVIIEKEADLDGDVRGWLVEAYTFAKSYGAQARPQRIIALTFYIIQAPN